MAVVDVSDPANPTIVGSLELPLGSAADVAVMGQYAYLANHSNGLKVIDVLDSAWPRVVGSVDMPGAEAAVAAQGTYVYVAAEADEGGGLRVVDITDPASPVMVGRLDTPYVCDVAVGGQLAYLVGGWGPSWLYVVDVSQPSLPKLLSTTPFPYGGAEIVIVGSLAYVASADGVVVFDIQNPVAPVLIGCGGNPLGGAYIAVCDSFVFRGPGLTGV